MDDKLFLAAMAVIVLIGLNRHPRAVARMVYFSCSIYRVKALA